MRIQFTQSGGILGTIRQCTLDTATMPAEAAKVLEALVERATASVPETSASESVSSKSGRDLEEYEIAVDDGKRTVKLVHDHSSLSDAMKPLVAYLKKCARPANP